MSDFRIAVIGDVHDCWNERDVEYFNASDYDLLLFVGDLPGRTHRSLLKVAGAIAPVTKPLLLMPGNHDAVSLRQLWGEITQDRGMIEKQSANQERRVEDLGAALGTADRIAGYSIHPQSADGFAFDIIGARPHSMGGAGIPGYAPYLKRRFTVDSQESSAELLKQIVDRTENERVLFLAHNGPTGLGAERTSIFGRDFHKEGGDFGDPDLEAAMAYARERKTVLGMVAGHMHHRCKGGGTRPWLVERAGTFYLNAARVPRIFKQDGRSCHHHVEIRLNETGARIFEVLWSGTAEERNEKTALPV